MKYNIMHIKYYVPIHSVFRYVLHWVAAHAIKQNFESNPLFIICVDQESRWGPPAVEVDVFAVVLTNYSHFFP